MYAPMEDKVDAEKEKFYDDLQTVIDRTPKSDTILVLADANAKLGKEDEYRGVSGKHTLLIKQKWGDVTRAGIRKQPNSYEYPVSA